MKSRRKEAFIKGEELPNDPVKVNLNDLEGSDSIEDMFRQESQSQQNDVRELFHEDRVKARTDLSARQIKLITKAYYMIKLTGIRDLNKLLSDFMTLRISDTRQSRKEYIEGLKAKIDNSMQGMMGNMRGQFGK